MTQDELRKIPVPKIHALGRFDGDPVRVAYHDRDAVWFSRLSGGGTFPIYLEDWTDLQHRFTDFPATNLGPYGMNIWE